jgi:homocysteine S-methyltransferase
VVAIGVNCTQPALLPTLIAAIRSGSGRPIFVYPNSGELWSAATRSWYGTSSIDDYARQAERWYAAGAQAVGGCCRTTPAHIRAVSQAHLVFQALAPPNAAGQSSLLL